MPQTTRPLTSIVCRLALYSIFSIAFLQPMVGLSQACDAQENPEILYQIAFILNDGSTLVLSDGSTWDVDHEGSLAAGQWQIGDQVCVTHLPDQDAIYITDLRYGDSVNVERQQY